MDAYLLPPSTASDLYHQAENTALDSSDHHILMRDGFGTFGVAFSATNTHPAAPSIEPPDSGVDQQGVPDHDAPIPRLPQRPLPSPFCLKGSAKSPVIWEGLKPVIQDLYIHQRLSLKEAGPKTACDSGQEYKKRLRDWGLQKYYTQPQKMDAIEQLTEAQAETHGHLSLRVNGQPSKNIDCGALSSKSGKVASLLPGLVQIPDKQRESIFRISGVHLHPSGFSSEWFARARPSTPC